MLHNDDPGGRALVMAMRAPWIDNIYRLQDIHEEVAQ
jgi:hypothetical protein